MQLQDYLGTIARDYSRHAGMSSPAQRMLRSAASLLAEHCPPGMLIKGRGGQARPTHTPWVGFFNPDETESPQRGIYVVYLFHEDLKSVALSLNQGITDVTKALGPAAAKSRLRSEASAIRASLTAADRARLDPTLNLGTGGFRQAAYEAANILAKVYRTGSLPPESKLKADLARMLAIYGRAVANKRHLLQARPGVMTTSSVSARGPDLPDDPLQDFKPRSHAEYRAFTRAQTITKSRSHELLIERYGRWVAGRGFSPSTKEHPKDLVIRKPGNEWLTEAKVVYRGNATNAVRAAIGQLLTYRYMIPAGTTGMLALFSESIGAGYVDLLESLGIPSVWWDAGTWAGSPGAVAAGLAES